jgi:hypothetical protein
MRVLEKQGLTRFPQCRPLLLPHSFPGLAELATDLLQCLRTRALVDQLVASGMDDLLARAQEGALFKNALGHTVAIVIELSCLRVGDTS